MTGCGETVLYITAARSIYDFCPLVNIQTDRQTDRQTDIQKCRQLMTGYIL